MGCCRRNFNPQTCLPRRMLQRSPSDLVSVSRNERARSVVVSLSFIPLCVALPGAELRPSRKREGDFSPVWLL